MVADHYAAEAPPLGCGFCRSKRREKSLNWKRKLRNSRFPQCPYERDAGNRLTHIVPISKFSVEKSNEEVCHRLYPEHRCCRWI